MAETISKTQPASASDLTAALEAAKARYIQRNPESLRLHEEAVRSLPGGNTRTVLYTAPFPLSMKSGREHKVIDEDGHEYTDFVAELTSGLYGHSHPILREALLKTINEVGLNLGATTAQEAKFAKLLCERFHLERIRFCNSGTEANLHALAGARGYTGKRKVVAFNGGYHGAVLSFGNGPAPNNVDTKDFVVARYNDVESARRAIEETPDLAAVIVEGMQGAGGCVLGDKDFLHAVQAAARKAGAVFILDEVMTSRLAPGGLRQTLELSPDLTTFGKYLGGGLAFGAFGGKENIMRVYDPRQQDSLNHSGTFNNNTLAMHAGYAGLTHVYTPEASVALTRTGDELLAKLRAVTDGTKFTWTGRGSIMASHMTDAGVRDVVRGEDIQERADLKDLFWLEMIEEGFWTTRRGSIALILGTPQEELDRFVVCVKAFVERHAELLAL